MEKIKVLNKIIVFIMKLEKLMSAITRLCKAANTIWEFIDKL